MPGPTYDDALQAVFARLGTSSAEHCVAVGEAAAELATTYGVDVAAARLAGLLHDWARENDRDGLIEAAREAGLAVGEVDVEVPYLLHARVGAAELAHEYPDLAPEIVRAIERHTTGAPDMTDLDRVVYIADMIEPRRSFPGVEELRAAVGEVPLDELYTRGYAASLEHLVRSRKRLHPDTIGAWNAIVAEESR